MNARRVGILLVAGLAVIAFAVWLSSKRHLDRATTAGDLVLPGLESNLNAVTEIRLVKGDQTRATLKKGASDWSVAERAYAADSGKVRKLLLDLGALNVVEEKTRNPVNYPQLGVEDVTSAQASGTRVDVVTPSKVYSIIIGKPSSAKSGYVRVPETQQSLLAAPSITVEADPKRWLDHSLVDIAHERVKAVELKPADGPAYTASREKQEQSDFSVSNIPKGRELASPVVADSIAGALGGMTLDDVRKPAAAGDAKLVRATFRTFDGLEVEVTGRKDGARDFIALNSRSTTQETAAEAQKLAALQGWEYEIPAYKYDALFRPLEDLLKKPETAAKATAGKSTKLPFGAATTD